MIRLIREVTALSGVGTEPEFGVYDFRNPASEDHGFSWREIASDWESWDRTQYVEALHHPFAERGFKADMAALDAATALLLVGPCGRSAHLELGYAIGKGIPTAIYLPEKQEPELMYKMADAIILSPQGLRSWTRSILK